MKKFLSEMKWNDRTKLALAALATGAVLLFSMLFPLAFRSRVTAEPDAVPASLEERAALFAAYWDAGDTEISSEKIETPDVEMKALCEAEMQQLIQRCIVDRRVENFAPDGSEYLRISDGETTATVCRMWLETTGDWKNWLDVCFDADTGEIYYLYLSCGNVSNPAEYTGVADLNCGRIISDLADCQGAFVRYTDGETNGTQTAVLSAPEGTICYTVKCTAYENLLDVKVGCF